MARKKPDPLAALKDEATSTGPNRGGPRRVVPDTPEVREAIRFLADHAPWTSARKAADMLYRHCGVRGLKDQPINERSLRGWVHERMPEAGEKLGWPRV